jgi:hypothetical protein
LVFIKRLTTPSDVDAGTATKAGGIDWNKLDDYHSDVDITGPANIATTTNYTTDKLRLWNPAKTFTYQFNSSAISADRNITYPLLTSDGTLAVLELAQTFTEPIGISKSGTASLFELYRPDNTATNGVEIDFSLNDSTSAKTDYARIRGEIEDATNGSEDGSLNFYAMKAGTLTKSMLLNETGDLDIGANLRIRLAETGLTGPRTFTFPDNTTTLVGTSTIQQNSLSNPYLNTSNASTRRQGLWVGVGDTTCEGALNTGCTAIVTGGTVTDTTEGFGRSFATTAVANANAGLRWTAARWRREWGIYMVCRVGFSSTSDIRVFIGFSSDTAEIAGETTLNNFSGVGVGRRAADTNWFTMRNDADATEDRVDTTIAHATAVTTIEVELDSTSFRSRIGGVKQTDQTTEIPGLTTNLAPHVQIETGAGAADKTITIYPIWAKIGPEVMIA